MPLDTAAICFYLSSLLTVVVCLLGIGALIAAGRNEKREGFVMKDEQITKAVKWWMDAIRNPTFRTLSEEERKAGRDRPAEFAEGETL